MYPNLSFTKPHNRPFFYTSFVTTIDGKVYVKKDGYWPIGSKNDFEVFTLLRAHSDVIIDGKNTALQFGKKTIETITSTHFMSLRTRLKKKEDPRYIILTHRPDEGLRKAMENPYGFSPQILSMNIPELVMYLQKENLEYIFIDGGPHLLASLLKHGLIDEVFLTIAPKIFGNEKDLTLTMVEGLLLDQNKTKLELVSLSKVENEVFLRYRITY